MASRLAEDNTRAKCTQVIIVKRGGGREGGREERVHKKGRLTEIL
jgi:hypothetical protein